MEDNSLCIVSRCKDEPYVKEFCDYYISQGVDMIYIIDDSSNSTAIYNTVKDNGLVKVITDQCKTAAHNGICPPICRCNRVVASEIYKTLRSKYKWFMYIDMDEYICTKKHADMTIKDQLINLEKVMNLSIECIFVPWVNMSNTNLIENPPSILEHVTYRPDYDKIYNEPDIVGGLGNKFSLKNRNGKCIFTGRLFHDITDHHPTHPVKKTIKLSATDMMPVDKSTKLTCNDSIDNSYFVCYHYRYISEEQIKCKLKTNNWYKINGYNWKNIKQMFDLADYLDLTMRNKYIVDDKS